MVLIIAQAQPKHHKKPYKRIVTLMDKKYHRKAKSPGPISQKEEGKMKLQPKEMLRNRR